MHQNAFGGRAPPRPAMGAYITPPDLHLLAGLKGGGKRGGGEGVRKGKWGREKGVQQGGERRKGEDPPNVWSALTPMMMFVVIYRKVGKIPIFIKLVTYIQYMCQIVATGIWEVKVKVRVKPRYWKSSNYNSLRYVHQMWQFNRVAFNENIVNPREVILSWNVTWENSRWRSVGGFHSLNAF